MDDLAIEVRENNGIYYKVWYAALFNDRSVQNTTQILLWKQFGNNAVTVGQSASVWEQHSSVAVVKLSIPVDGHLRKCYFRQLGRTVSCTVGYFPSSGNG